MFCIRTMPFDAADLAILDTDEEEAKDCGIGARSVAPADVAGLLPADLGVRFGYGPLSRDKSDDDDPRYLVGIARGGRGGRGGASRTAGGGVTEATLRLDSERGLVNLCHREGFGVAGAIGPALPTWAVLGVKDVISFSLLSRELAVGVLARYPFDNVFFTAIKVADRWTLGLIDERDFILGIGSSDRDSTTRSTNGTGIGAEGARGLLMAIVDRV